ncbi:MAG: hypothetical protein WBN53_19395, partial [Thermodesulfobacteriota bacterium]
HHICTRQAEGLKQKRQLWCGVSYYSITFKMESCEIATPACRNFILLRALLFKHCSVQARRPAKAGLSQ